MANPTDSTKHAPRNDTRDRTTKDEALEVRFWGVRGSLPSPGGETAVVGGNTACVEVTGGGARIILDAGSGIRALGDELVAKNEHQRVTILLSHVHWDHVLGLPFFTPLYMTGSEICLMSGAVGGMSLRDVLKAQMIKPLFPVPFEVVSSRVRTVELPERARFAVGPLEVSTAVLNHPDPVVAYRIDFAGRSVVYATDTEHEEGKVDQRLVELARGADVLVYDAQYTPEEYRGECGPTKRGWGHSTFEAGIRVARDAGVKTLALFHHDPRRSDDGVSEIVQRARASFPNTVAARERTSLRLEAEPFGPSYRTSS
ncbi:MAG: MBL fold metallo-hydrolase [Polyangiaceae bacterium]|nr:MBL fold metallo-hydrolase [Polyangiaceae bacterium]